MVLSDVVPFSAMGWIESIAFHHRHDKERKERLVLRRFLFHVFGFYTRFLPASSGVCGDWFAGLAVIALRCC